MLSQKEATYKAITQVCGVHEGPYHPTKDQREQISMILIEGFKSGAISLDREFSDAQLKAYVSGLVSNWLRKDTRLNGGCKYQPKNPGARLGATDPQLKALRALMKTLTDESERQEVQKYIDARLAEISKEKSKVEIDLSALPEELRSKFAK